MAEDKCEFCSRPIEGWGAGISIGGKRAHKSCADMMLEKAVETRWRIGIVEDGRK